MLDILVVALGIGLLIFIHEGGHFLAARLAGVRVEVFSLGFGPRIGGFVWRGTDFRLSAVPFGGYVMVAGQDPTDRRYPAGECLWSKTPGQRALFWSGGVIMNLLFALVAFPIVFGIGVSFEAPVTGPVAPGTAAWEVGIDRGDRILEVAGKPVTSMINCKTEIALRGNRPVELLVESADGTRRTVTAEPQFDREAGVYSLGLTPWFDPDKVFLEVLPDGPAAAAGLVSGDRVVRINGRSPADPEAIDGIAPALVVVERDGEQITTTVTPKATTEGQKPLLGVTPLQNRVRGIRPGSKLVERLGLRRGDVVLAIDGRPFLTGRFEDYADGPGTTTWLVLRDGVETTLTAAATAEERRQLSAHIGMSGDLRLQIVPTPNGAAARAGVRAGDWLRAIDGRSLTDWNDLREAVLAAGERALRLALLRPDPNTVVKDLHLPTGTPLDLTVTPTAEPRPEFGWKLTFTPLMVEVRAASFGDAVARGAIASLDLIKQLYVTMKRLVTGEVGTNNLGGIIRISEVSYHAVQRGLPWFCYFLALLSVNLAFVNLLPIPVLDGGHLMFLLIEKVKGSPVSNRVFGYSQVIGLVFVLLLVLFVTYNDILRLL